MRTPRSKDGDPAGNHIPGAVAFTGGRTLGEEFGWFGSAKLRRERGWQTRFEKGGKPLEKARSIKIFRRGWRS